MANTSPVRPEQRGEDLSSSVNTSLSLPLEQLSLTSTTSGAQPWPVTSLKRQQATPSHRHRVEVMNKCFHPEDIPDDDDARFTSVPHENRQPPGITVIFRPKCKERSFWRVNPNSLANEVLALARGNVLSSRIAEDGSLFVTVASRPLANRLLSQTRICGVDVETATPTFHSESLGNIRGVPLESSECDLLEYFRDQDVTAVQRQISYERHGDGSSTPRPKGSVNLGFTGDLPAPPRVRLGVTIYPVEEYSGTPVQCFECQRFGHVARNFRFACGCKARAGSHDQEERTYRAKPRCSNCGGSHTATLSGCPFKKYAAVLRRQQIQRGRPPSPELTRTLDERELQRPDAVQGSNSIVSRAGSLLARSTTEQSSWSSPAEFVLHSTQRLKVKVCNSSG